MKKTYLKSILRAIRHSLSRFVAIFSIVALGAGFLAGVLASPLDMRISADRYCRDTDMFHIKVVSTLGLTAADMEALRDLPQTSRVMPAYDTDLVLVSSQGDSYTTRLHSLPEEGWDALNTPVLQEGHLPQAPGECAVVLTRSFFEDNGWVGRTLTVEEDQEGLPREFTVVGTVKSSLYLSLEQEHSTAGTGTLGLMAYTVPETFDQDYYTAAYLTVAGAEDLNAFYSEYENLTAQAEEALEPLGGERSRLRYEELVDEANAQLADAKQELEDGRGELADGRTKLETETASARQQIAQGRSQIQSYQAQLDSGRGEINSARQTLQKGYAELDAGDIQLAQAKAQLDETQANLDGIDQGKAALNQLAAQLGLPGGDGSDGAALALLSQLELAAPEAAAQFAGLKAGLQALAAQGTDSAAARTALEAGRAEYEKNLAKAQEARAQLDAGLAQLNAQAAELESQQNNLNAQKAQLDRSQAQLDQSVREAQEKFAQAEADLAQGQKDYDEGAAELAQARKDLEEGWEDYREGKAEADQELAEAREELEDAEREIGEIEEGEWLVFTREDNASFSSYASNADKIAAIASVFPVFFFLVAALVALTTMTRMVEEERQQIGTLKALGYTAGQIAGKYLFYAAAASLLGSVAGVAAGMWLFPTVIINAYNIMYDLPVVYTPFSWPLAGFSTVTATLCTLAATLNACWAALREVPARLMLPRASKAGKRVLLEYITPLWKRLRFTQKVTIRNLFRYKKRFFMTVTGIAGCTALLVTGFGIRDSISDIVALQYNELCQYQLIVGLSDEAALEDPQLQAILEDPARIEDALPVTQESGQVVPAGNGPKDDITIFVPQEVERLPEFFQFRHRTDSEPVEYGPGAVIVTEKLAERQGLRVGDRITVKNQDEDEASFAITDICENYVHHYLYISPAAYREAYGQDPAVNSLLCRLPEEGPAGGEDELSTQLLQCEDVAMTTSTVELSASFQNSIQSINYIVVVLIVSAGALAFVVVYNLTNINVTEREKELATIKVLGFYDGEVAAYVYRETAALTAIGAGAGLLLGVALHQFVIRTAEIDMVMFGRSIYAPSYLWAALLTVAFSVLVNLVMYRKLTGIRMVESMKAPE
ncbi:FtsX-like permease family protein [Oscillospiraceae bacterium 42-9]